MNIRELIETIEKRPGMFVFEVKLESIATFISGFLFSKIINKQEDAIDRQFKQEFNSWVENWLIENKNVSFEEKRDYTYYINLVVSEEDERLKMFFKLSNNFFTQHIN